MRPTTSSATSAPCRTRSAQTSRRSIRSSATRPRHWSSAPRRNPPSAAGRSWSCPRPNLLIGAINREGRIITPGGRDTIEPGDTVVVVTAATGLNDLDDILDKRRVKA
ncbi:MAG: TrkA C-terminal domain-containing protein [Oscillospiraceae bacterium]